MPYADITFTLIASDLRNAFRSTRLSSFGVNGASDSRLTDWFIRLRSRGIHIAYGVVEVDERWKNVHKIEQYSRGALIDIGNLAWWLPTRIFSNKSEFERLVSQMIIAAAEVRHRKCPECRFDLRGNPDAGCPECGWRRETAEPHSDSIG